MIHYPRAVAFLYWEAKEFKKSSSSRRARVQEELNLPVCEQKSQSWWHHDEPSHNYKMAAKSVIMIHYPRAVACLYREAKEFKKSSSSRRAQFTVWEQKSQSWRHHDEPSHNYTMAAKSVIMIHYPSVSAGLYWEAKEFKKNSSSRRAQHDPLP